MKEKDPYAQFNAYKIMWIFVYFDLPTQTKKQKKAYTKFRKALLNDGFSMMQYSIYQRHCPSRENAEVHKKRVRASLPPEGNIAIFEITDKQFERIETYYGAVQSKKPDAPQQLELF